MGPMLRVLAFFVAFGLTSVINPGAFAGCASDAGDRFEFGEPELVDLLDAANATSPFELNQSGARYRLELAMLQQPGDDTEDLRVERPLEAMFSARAFACGSRSFMQKAQACVTQTGMPVLARFTLYRLDADGAAAVVSDHELSGTLRVIGTALTNAHVTLSDSNDDTRIELRSRDGRSFVLAHFHVQLDGTLTVF